MCSKTMTETSTDAYTTKIKQLKEAIKEAEVILIGAGAGLSTAAGFTYSGERFEKYFSDFQQKYQITDMYIGGFYPFETLEEYWAWWSRHIYYNRYERIESNVYTNLLDIVRDKNYFVLTTNVDHQFQLAGFDKQRLFYTQGDYGLFQCGKGCHQKTYDNEEMIREMITNQQDMKIPSELIPYCPICGSPMTPNLRADATFVEDGGWHQACRRYESFANNYRKEKVLYLEIGVGQNTPSIIKYPFWQLTFTNKNATYACVNYGEAYCPYQIEKQSICINEDIKKVLEDLIQ